MKNLVGQVNAVINLKGVGAKVREKLARLNISSTQDLLFHLPLRYENRTKIFPIRMARPGNQVLVEGVVEASEVISSGRRRLSCLVRDESGYLNLCFFHFNYGMQKALERGNKIRCFGEIKFGYRGLEMVHPEFRVINKNYCPKLDETLTPVYPSTEGLNQSSLRNFIDQAIEVFLSTNENALAELIPAEILAENKFPTLKHALLYLHRPPKDAALEILLSGKHLFQERLAYEELLAHQIGLQQLRKISKSHLAPKIELSQEILAPKFLANLSFKLTKAQQKVIQEIKIDMQKAHPMLRLVQGDVGSGKTVVAAIAAAHVVQNNFQVAIMAPTEILAEQHYKNFLYWFKPLKIEVEYLCGSIKNKKSSLEKIQNGTAKIIVGTHALFQEQVDFHDLALVIVDEQHRFGVHQRLALREKGMKKGRYPHQLIMTATPIPRTLAMSFYSDLDNSIIDELPPGRKKITTVAVDNRRRNEIIRRIKSACAQKKQVYWVCTLIEESEFLQCQAAIEAAKMLKNTLPNLKIDLVHGRMKANEKEKIMADFKAGRSDILVATTVIEVGVDVPNASLMIIENAERLGLSQLHQLRGRVGRGEIESFCVLLYKFPLAEIAKERLAIMRKTNDGFLIAEKDLTLRGPGEILGVRQSGMLKMKIADLIRDAKFLPSIKKAAETIVEIYPEKIAPLMERWIGKKEEYYRG